MTSQPVVFVILLYEIIRQYKQNCRIITNFADVYYNTLMFMCYEESD